MIIRNTYWNLLGHGVPILVAILAIPPVIRNLGTERFGVLAIGWVVMAYFSLFDLGLSRATVKFISEDVAHNKLLGASETAWNSLWAHLGLGFAGAGVFGLIAPWLVRNMFVISPELQRESLGAFYWLAASIPLIVMSGCLRGVLEGLHRFDLVNLVKIPAGSINYLIPLLVLLFANDLVVIVATIFVGRALTLIAYAYLVIRTFPSMNWACGMKWEALRRLFSFGLPVTVSSLVMPVLLFADRFFIAGIFSVEAVTYYVVPYELVTKMWIFSASLMGAMFPVLSALSISRVSELKVLGRRAFVFLLIFVTPVVGVAIALGRELLGLWVGPEFAAQSGTVLKWLALGVFINILAQVPYTIVQCVGRPDIVAGLHLIQLPIYLLLVWYLGNMLGTVGVAMAWALRALLDGIFMLAAVLWCVPIDLAKWRVRPAIEKGLPILAFLCAAWLIDRVWRAELSVVLALFPIFIASFVLWEWYLLLTVSDRNEFLTYFSFGRAHS